MLVIISDLHFKDGTSGTSITPDAFRIFAERLGALAYQASFRANDSAYQPVENIDLVLLGDVFDQIRSVKWLEVDGKPVSLRPWDDHNQPAFIRKIEAINDAILSHNAEAFEVIREISDGKLVTLPPATNDEKPDPLSDEQRPVDVRIYCMTGNHDWFFYIPGEPYNQIRKRVVDALRLSNTDRPFPYEPSDSPVLEEIFAQHQVYARHGDLFDSMNYDPQKGRVSATLGDALAVELLDRFPFDVKKAMGDELPQQFIDGLKELANVRPALVTPLWVGHLINRYTTTDQQAEEVKEIWNTLVKRFLRLDYVRSFDRIFKYDTVDALEGVLLLSKELPFEAINRILGWIGEKLWGNKISIARHALEEAAFKDQTAKYIVYGHTHFHEVVPLDSNMVNGSLFNQFYLNSGTWHSYHDLTLRDPSQHKFVATNVMTYLTFFKEDERKRHAFESWSGSLAMPVT